MKKQSKCCKRYKRKAKACKSCPLVLALGCPRKRKHLLRAVEQRRAAA